MKSSHGDSTSQNCSCTSCFYKTESERPSLRGMLLDGSRIDKLYLGKYIPMREQKLLNKLVRTRAVYDDIRKQLLPDSNISADIKVMRPDALEESRKSSAVLELVNLVDKGAKGRTSLSDCCSCCSCGSSKLRLIRDATEARPHRHAHTASRTRLYQKHRISGHRQAHIGSRTRMYQRYETSGYRKYRADHRSRRHGQHKAKHIRSDPCSCILKSTGLLKRLSKASIKRTRTRNPQVELELLPLGRISQENKIGRGIKFKQSYHKIEDSLGEAVKKSAVKIKHTKRKIESAVKKSIENIKNTESKIKATVSENLKELIENAKGKYSGELKNADIVELYENTFDVDLALQEPLSEHEEDIQRKILLEKWACDFACDPKECNPAECLERKKQSLHEQETKHHDKTKRYMSKKSETSLASSIDFPVKNEKVTRTETRNKKIASKSNKKSASNFQSGKGKTSHHEAAIQINVKGKNKKAGDTHKPGSPEPVSKKRHLLKNTKQESPPLISLQKYQRVPITQRPPIMTTKHRTRSERHEVHRKNKETMPVQKQTHHEIVRTSQNVLKDAQLHGYDLKRCFCTIKLKSKTTKQKKAQTHKSVTKNLQTVKWPKLPPPVLLPYECEPMICVPGKCDPIQCEKIIRQRNAKHHTVYTNTHYPTHHSKSTPSLASKTVFTGENEGDHPNNQLRSTNTRSHPHKGTLKFEKVGKGEYKKQVNKAVQPKVHVAHKTSQMNSAGTSKHTLTKHRLRRCFCTLRLDKPIKIKPHMQSISKGTLISGKTIPAVEAKHTGLDKATEKQDNREFVMTLSPYECEPGICISGECNPYECLKVISNRHTKRNDKTAVIEEKMDQKVEMATKGTKIAKRQIKYQLEPYECEPHACIPGECDPYQCLERIKKREKSKSKEFGMITSKNKIKSTSSVPLTKSKNAEMQSAFEIEHTIKQKVHTKKKRQHPSHTTLSHNSRTKAEVLQEAPSRQAVRISSNFSFNIEIYKDNTSIKSIEKPMQQIYSSANPSKVLKNRGENPYKLYVQGRESQSRKENKLNKATGVRPMLKRCFCTLKLQKNKRNNKTSDDVNTRRIEATVMPAQIFYKNVNVQNTNTDKVSKSHKVNYSRCNVSKLSSSLMECNVKRNELTANISSTDKTFKHNQMFQLNPFIKSSFYAMNLQVQNKLKKGYKLEPYECEPGLCVPGQCDPIECQKRIMRRLLRKASTMTSTQIRSISSDTSRLHPDSRSQKQQFREYVPKATHERNRLRYRTLPNSQRQAVRVGSAFSFNVEFSKERVAAPGRVQKRNGSVTSMKTVWKERRLKTQGTGRYGTKNRESQSATGMHHKGSNITPKYKRCYCTLKLQKRGYQQKATGDKMKVKRPVNVIKTKTMGQNTKKEKHYNIRNLDPYECEPYVCVPGECDPYECLERIKRRDRRHFGTGSESQYVSTSSMTNDINRHTRGKYVQHNTKAPRSGKVRKSNVYSKPISKSFVQPSRQAVRLGSSFSFNVEFYKDKSMTNEGLNVFPLSNNYYKRQPRARTDKTARNLHSVQSSDISIQDSRKYVDQNEQVITATKHEASKTSSFLQRCFCTAKLYNRKGEVNNNQLGNIKVTKDTEIKLANTGIAKRKRWSSAFMEKFLPKYFISGRSPNRRKGVKPLDKKHAGTYSQTDKIREKRPQRGHNFSNLKTYECEPGFCEPGQCDPYVCAERIKKRRNFNKKSYTEVPNTKSVRTNFYSPKVSKSTSSNIPSLKYKYDQGRPRKQLKEKNMLQYSSPERNSVKIGSNFSFNVEFFKDRTPERCLSTAKEFKGPSRSKIVSHDTGGGKLKTKEKALDRAIILHSYESQAQAVRKEHRAAGVRPILKRCFCTLALNKQTTKEIMPKQKRDVRKENFNKMVSRKTDSPVITIPKSKNAYDKTRPYKLKPYECEPGVCIPGQCNPYVCEKLIRKRQHREFGTSHRLQIRSTMSEARIGNKLKDVQSQQSFDRSPVKRRQYLESSPNLKQVDHDRQVVRIGSNFSFNVEFYKDRSLGSISNRKVQEIAEKLKKGTYCNESTCRDQTNFVHRQKQKASGIGPLLKRCFCTLKLQKYRKQQFKIEVIPKKTAHNAAVLANRGLNIKYEPTFNKEAGTRARKFHPNLKPYEFETGVSLPGYCNAVECYKQIQKRNLRTFGTGTSRPPTKSVCSVTCERRLQKRNVQTPLEKTVTRKSTDNRPRLLNSIGKSHAAAMNNRQAVRIGSNFNFNIEFYKNRPQTLQVHELRELRDKMKQLKSNKIVEVNKKCTNTRWSLKDRDMQAKHRTENKASAAGKALKRCFCTAKLHAAQAGNIREQVFTVGRIDKIETLSPFKPIQYCRKQEIRNNRCTCLRKQKKSVGTKNKDKCLKSTKEQNDLYPQKVKISRLTKKSVNFNSVVTAIPKYRKHRSSKMKEDCPDVQGEYAVFKISGDELTKTISVINNPDDSMAKTTVVLIGGTEVDCKINQGCKTTETVKQKKTNNTDEKKLNNLRDKHKKKQVRNRKNMETILPYTPKNFQKNDSQTLMTQKTKYCGLQCTRTRDFCQHANGTTSKELADTSSIFLKIKRFLLKYFQMLSKQKDEKLNYELKYKDLEISNDLQKSNSERKPQKLCSKTKTSKGVKLTNFGFKNMVLKDPNAIETTRPTDRKQDKLANNVLENIKDNPRPKHIASPKDSSKPTNTVVKISGSNISYTLSKDGEKAAGDTIITHYKTKSVLKKHCAPAVTCERNIHSKINIRKPLQVQNDHPSCKDISSPKNSKKPIVTVVTLNGTDISYTVSKDGDKAAGDTTNTNYNNKNRPKKHVSYGANLEIKGKLLQKNRSKKPCECRSSVCAKESKGAIKLAALKGKPCLCGGRVCKRLTDERPDMNIMPKGIFRFRKEFIPPANKKCGCKICKLKRKKLLIKHKKLMKEFKKRLKEDAIRRKHRKANEKVKFAQVKKHKNIGDAMLLTESVLDIAKLGVTTAGDVVRSGYKAAANPKVTYHYVNTLVKDPKRGCAVCKNAFYDSGLISTSKRVAMRFAAMNIVKRAKRTLESYAVTNCMLHMCDRDPKIRLKRQKKKKKIRKREPVDFECSLYMASLRRRPYLGVYYMCPWFYPHFISMIHVWRQFVDVILFLLAVGVWSPCIFAAEACRAMMCCLLCNG